MISTFRRIFKILSKRQKRDFYILQLFMLLTSFSELVGAASIMPFIALASDPELVLSNRHISKLYQFFDYPDYGRFLIITGIIFVLFVLISNGLLLFSQFLMNRYSFRLGGEFSSSLYSYYLSRDVNFHSVVNSSTLNQRVMRDSLVLSTGLIGPALKLNARLLSIILLTMLLFIVDAVVAFTSFAVLAGAYWLIFKIIRKKIYKNGRLISDLERRRNRLLSESLEGIKELKLYEAEDTFRDRYTETIKRFSRASANNQILGESPYYLVETLVLSCSVLVILYFVSTAGELTEILPTLSLYCIAGLKLVPKLQQSYMAFTRIKATQPVFSLLSSDIEKASALKIEASKADHPLYPKKNIALSNITYRYPSSEKPALLNFSATITLGKLTAITGPSGAGKSTLLNILTGLILPEQGSVYIDNKKLTNNNMSSWRKALAYVPQKIYLVDGSIGENIAFGSSNAYIDIDRLHRAAALADIDCFISQLPEGYDTNIGERGSKLSGGQIQRIGLARALYRKATVLILDEVTSALDNDTQSRVLSAAKSLSPYMTTIMVTHRQESLHLADEIIHLIK